MKIEELKVSDLIPYENNPRKNEGAVDAVAESIREFGFKVPIVVDKENVIVSGHTRLAAAKKIGLETVPAVRADQLTEEQIKAFRLADNKTSELGEWDLEALSDCLASLEGNDLSRFGFVASEYETPDYSDYFSEVSFEGQKKEANEREREGVKEAQEDDLLTCPHCHSSFARGAAETRWTA